VIQAAAILCWVSAFGFGLPNLPAIRNVVEGRAVPLLFGFPAYGGGYFERFGITTTVPLLVAFLIVCVLEGVAGWLLWDRQRSGAILALTLLLPGMVFWIGFSLPFGPVFAVIRTVLMLASWSSLK
jgi:hypothetical protein